MIYAKITSMNTLKRWAFVFIVAMSATFSMQAQDTPAAETEAATPATTASAAAMYNESLASLKAKDFQAGYDKTKAALAAAKAEENEQIIGLATKNLAKAAYYLGQKKLKDKSVDEAMKLFEEGIATNPEFPGAYKGKASGLAAKGQSVEAINTYFKSAELSEKAGKAKSAAKTIKKAASVVSKLYSSKDYAKTIEAGKAFLAVNDDSHKVHYYMAKSHQKQKGYATALTHINKAVEQAGDKAKDKYFWAQGNIAEKAGKKSAAIAAYKKITDAKYKENAEFKIKELQK